MGFSGYDEKKAFLTLALLPVAHAFLGPMRASKTPAASESRRGLVS